MKPTALAVLLTPILPLLCACAGTPGFMAQPQDVEAAGPYRHEASGMVFPEQVAGFNRTRIAHFAADGSDAAVAYDLVTPKGDVAATVYLHRAPALFTVGLAPESVAAEQARSCAGELARRTDEMLRTHLDPSPPRRREVSVVSGGRTRTGMAVASSYAAGLPDGAGRVKTELAVFCRAGSGWTLEFRYSFADGFRAEDRDAAFMGALDWSPLG